MEFNTNLFRRPTELVHSSVNPHTHWAIVKFTSTHDCTTLLTVAESIIPLAFGLMGFYLRAHSGLRSNYEMYIYIYNQDLYSSLWIALSEINKYCTECDEDSFWTKL